MFYRIKSRGQLDYVRESNPQRPEIAFTTLTAMFYVGIVGYTSSIIVFVFELYGESMIRLIKGRKILKLGQN